MNQVMGADVSVDSGDVDVPATRPDGQANRVKVNVYRTTARGNPVSTLIAQFFGMQDRRHRRDRDRRSVARQRHDLRQAVHDSRQVDRGADRRRGTATIPTTRSTTRACRSRNPGHLHPRGPARLYRLQPGVQSRPELVIRAATGKNITVSFYFSLAIDGMDGTGGDGLPLEHRQLQHARSCTGATRWSRSPARWRARRSRAPTN